MTILVHEVETETDTRITFNLNNTCDLALQRQRQETYTVSLRLVQATLRAMVEPGSSDMYPAFRRLRQADV